MRRRAVALTLRIKTFLTRNGHPFKYLDLDRDLDVRHLLDRFGVNPADIPVLICRRHAVLVVEAAGHQVRKAFDGRSGISAALEYQPDLILLDISLPGITGIEAARQIRKVSPDSNIIFLSQHDSLQMVSEALRNGHGYVTKSDAALQLLEAVRSVRNGSLFVSKRIADQGWVADSLSLM